MTKLKVCQFIAALVCAWVLVAGAVRADSASYSATLANPETPFETTLALGAASNITLQTDSFGEGETDPFLAIFDGAGNILTDGFGNPFGSSLDLSNYGMFAGCPPASTVTIGGSPVCGDITMTLSNLAAGTYTIVLSDGEYIANAVFDNGNLSEGFTDLTGGRFCNLSINGVNCPNTEGTFSFSVLTTPATGTVPEPGSLALLSMGVLRLANFVRRSP